MQQSKTQNLYWRTCDAKRMANRVEYLKRKLENFTLEEVFEQFDLDPEDTLLRLHTLGLVDLDYYMDDEFVDTDETEFEDDREA